MNYLALIMIKYGVILDLLLTHNVLEVILKYGFAFRSWKLKI